MPGIWGNVESHCPVPGPPQNLPSQGRPRRIAKLRDQPRHRTGSMMAQKNWGEAAGGIDSGAWNKLCLPWMESA